MKIMIVISCIFIISMIGICYGKKMKDFPAFYFSIILVVINGWYVLISVISHFFSYNYLTFLVGSIIYYCILYIFLKLCFTVISIDK